MYTVKFISVLGGGTSGGGDGEEEISIGGEARGPIEKFLPVLNGVLAVVVGLGTYVQRPKGEGMAGGREMTLEAWAGYFPLGMSNFFLLLPGLVEHAIDDEASLQRYTQCL